MLATEAKTACARVRLWHRARDFDRGTHQPGHHGGAVGHAGLAVLHALIFDFLNHRTGRLDPSYAAIAAKAGVCVRTVASALQRLKALGILNWVRRCAENWRDGRFVLEQQSNAYAVLPEASGAATGRQQSRQGQRRAPGAIHRPCCCRRSPRRRWRAIWRARCRRWPAIRRMASRSPWPG